MMNQDLKPNKKCPDCLSELSYSAFVGTGERENRRKRASESRDVIKVDILYFKEDLANSSTL